MCVNAIPGCLNILLCCLSRPYRRVDVELAIDRAVGNMVAASDTTRYALFIVLASIALSPAVQDKIREEQKKVRAGPLVP